jgi:hypothetical protein
MIAAAATLLLVDGLAGRRREGDRGLHAESAESRAREAAIVRTRLVSRKGDLALNTGTRGDNLALSVAARVGEVQRPHALRGHLPAPLARC